MSAHLILYRQLFPRSIRAALLAVACSTDQITPPQNDLATAAANPVTVYAAGDIAGSSSSYRDKETSDIIVADPSALAFPLGDNVYNDAGLARYRADYAPTWGRFLNRTWPVPGNQEYNTANAPGYFGYFAGRVSAPYYARDIGSWRWYFLNSELGSRGSSATSPQGKWLKADLAANPRACVGASWHKPLYTSYGVSRAMHSPATFMRPLVQILYNAGADLILAAHNHLYERHTQVNPAGQTDLTGPRAFTVGTGGAGVATAMPTIVARTRQKIILGTRGLLRLTLADGSYAWRFVPIAGESGSDAGSAPCSRAGH